MKRPFAMVVALLPAQPATSGKPSVFKQAG
jgi:hypothetical protein